MSAVYGNWERLVGATLRREQLRRTALRSFSDLSLASFNSRASFRLSSFNLSEGEAFDNDLVPFAPNFLKIFTFAVLKNAIENFNSHRLVWGEPDFGSVFKGWVDEETYAPSRVGVEMAVAIKKSYLDSLEGHREWQLPLFQNMDEKLLDAICERLKPCLYTENTYIVHEGDSVDEMLCIMRGRLESVTTDGGRSGFLNRSLLKDGDFCGEELLTSALGPGSNLPSSTRTVKALTEVEAFAVTADEWKFVAGQFRRLYSVQVLKHAFRFYSVQWRTWAACFIQAAWHRYCKRKLMGLLKKMEEDEVELAGSRYNATGGSYRLGATFLSSRFAANALRGVHRILKGTRRLVKPPKPSVSRHTFRFYSQQWRIWAACSIQAAWRRYYSRKLMKLLKETEDELELAEASNNATGGSYSLRATFLAGRFAANALWGVHRILKGTRRLVKPAKPPEPISVLTRIN